MANIKLKNVNELEAWTQKELRKLRMVIRNRISAFETSGGPKDLEKGHPLYGLDMGQCQELLQKVQSQEAKL